MQETNNNLKRLIEIKKEIKSRQPKFKRYVGIRPKTVKRVNLDSWKKPRGNSNKLKLCIKGRGSLVKIGYGSPKILRNTFNANKYIIIKNINDLKKCIKEKYKYCILFSKLGTLKKIIFSNILKKNNIKVKNYISLNSLKNKESNLKLIDLYISKIN